MCHFISSSYILTFTWEVTAIFYGSFLRHNTHHNIDHFIMYSSVVFNTFSALCNHHHSLIPEHFYQPISSHSPSPPPDSMWQLLTCILSLKIGLSCTSHINRITQHVVLGVWFLSLRRMISRFTHGVACISTLFIFMAKYYYSIVLIEHILFSYLFIEEHLGCLFPLQGHGE